jgi:hypothetical protein
VTRNFATTTPNQPGTGTSDDNDQRGVVFAVGRS